MKNLTKEKRVLRMWAVVELQSIWRQRLAKLERARREARRDDAAVVLQSAWWQTRARVERRRLQQLVAGLEHDASVCIQTIWRGVAARKMRRQLEVANEAAVLLAAREAAALIIQTAWRGVLAGAKVWHVHQAVRLAAAWTHNNAAVQIQTCWRRVAVRLAERRDVVAVTAAVRLQSCWRQVAAQRERERRELSRADAAADYEAKWRQSSAVRANAAAAGWDAATAAAAVKKAEGVAKVPLVGLVLGFGQPAVVRSKTLDNLIGAMCLAGLPDAQPPPRKRPTMDSRVAAVIIQRMARGRAARCAVEQARKLILSDFPMRLPRGRTPKTAAAAAATGWVGKLAAEVEQSRWAEWERTAATGLERSGRANAASACGYEAAEMAFSAAAKAQGVNPRRPVSSGGLSSGGIGLGYRSGGDRLHAPLVVDQLGWPLTGSGRPSTDPGLTGGLRPSRSRWSADPEEEGAVADAARALAADAWQRPTTPEELGWRPPKQSKVAKLTQPPRRRRAPSASTKLAESWWASMLEPSATTPVGAMMAPSQPRSQQRTAEKKKRGSPYAATVQGAESWVAGEAATMQAQAQSMTALWFAETGHQNKWRHTELRSLHSSLRQY